MWGTYFDSTPEVGHNISVLLFVQCSVSVYYSLFCGERLRRNIFNILYSINT